jgi:hypothetical protein
MELISSPLGDDLEGCICRVGDTNKVEDCDLAYFCLI